MPTFTDDNDALRNALRAGELLLACEQTLLPQGAAAGIGVHVRGGRFAAVGALDDVRAQAPGVPVLALPRTLLMPGFVDAHHHLTQSFGKALAFGEPSEIFRRIWVPLEGSLDAHGLYLAAKLAALEALRGGFTTVCDAGVRSAHGLQALAAATGEAGLRCVAAHVCNDDGSDASRHRQVLAEAARFLAAVPGDAARSPLWHPSLAISIPEAASDAMLRDAARLAAEAHCVLQIHVNEHLASVERSLVARGLRPLEHLQAAGALGPHALLAHCTMLTPAEMLLLQGSGSAVAVNPVASPWKGNAVAPAQMLAALGVRLGLGTDGTRSDAFRMMDAAESNQRLAFGLASGDSVCGGGRLWLDMAQRGGADAAGLGAVTGRIEAGLAADFLLLDLDVPELTPSWNLDWELVRLASREQIVSVHVAGRQRLWRGWPVDWDARALLAEVREAAARQVAAAPIHKVHRPQG
ncbi:MAG: amidohydrolase family protein [Rubrivivax sp.]|nr:amidohydrolase family protein [Rubrivivax sp.]